MPIISSVTDYFATVFENTVTMSLGGTIAPGATTVPVNGMTNYSNGQVVVFTVDGPTPSLKQVFTGTVSGTDVVNVVWTYGTNQTHTTGAPVIDYVSATTFDMVTTGILKQHTQTGSHTGITTDTFAASGDATIGGTLEVSGNTSLEGTLTVTGTSNFTGAVTLPHQTVSASMLNTSVNAAVVPTSETTASTSYTDLATTTDTCTVTIGVNGFAFVSLMARMANNTNDAKCYVSVNISGNSTVAATDINSLMFQSVAANQVGQMGTAFLVTGLTAGSTTFKMKYRVEDGGSGAGTGTWINRRIAVVPL